MARVGVDYETIKHTAIKLLSQGHAPSVQKVREVLGTGSNTTIAEHLKTWREEHASKEIHHLPANMPKELISAIEVLWQTAMDQAVQQLASIKHDLNEQQEKFRLEKAAHEKADDDLRSQLGITLKSIDEKNNSIQILQTDVAVSQEKLKQQSNDIITQKEQYEKKLNRAYIEKNNEIEKGEKLQTEIIRLTQEINDQSKKYQQSMQDERNLQEESEKRWVQLIDQARTETNEQRKRFENTINKQMAQIEKKQTQLSDLQEKQSTYQSTLNLKNARIGELNDQQQQLQKKFQELFAENFVLKEQINHFLNKTKNAVKKKQQKIIE